MIGFIVLFLVCGGVVGYVRGRETGLRRGKRSGQETVLREVENLLTILEHPQGMREKNPEGWDKMVRRMYQFARDHRSRMK